MNYELSENKMNNKKEQNEKIIENSKN